MKKKDALNRNKYHSKPQQSSSRRRVTWPKVNSVPVRKQRFSKSSAALKIQKVFRGFLVRKSVNKISSVRNEVVKLEQRINNSDSINSIRDDDKERLRLNETIMSLLFKLDSVRGVDCGVRDYRKSVTKKAIALQEKLDLIAGGQQPPPPPPPPPLPAAADDDSSLTNNNEYCSKEILEKMICENNDKMMKLMIMQMSERNDMQTRMIDSLSRRVEQLEKAAFVNDDDQLRRTNNNETNTNVSSRRCKMIETDKDDDR